MCPWTAIKDKGGVEKISNQAIKGEQAEKGLTSNAKPNVALVEESKRLGLLKENNLGEMFKTSR